MKTKQLPLLLLFSQAACSEEIKITMANQNTSLPNTQNNDSSLPVDDTLPVEEEEEEEEEEEVEEEEEEDVEEEEEEETECVVNNEMFSLISANVASEMGTVLHVRWNTYEPYRGYVQFLDATDQWQDTPLI